MEASPPEEQVVLPSHDGLYYGGAWHAPAQRGYMEARSPSDGLQLGRSAVATAEDVDLAIRAAEAGFRAWKRIPLLERADLLRGIADRIRANAREIALLDAAGSGNPFRDLIQDVHTAAAWFEFYAGLTTELKGASIPFGPDSVTFSVREPYGVVARIVAFNHPFMFSAGKIAAPLAAGNAVIIKPPEQAPLSALRLAELVGDLVPAGTIGIVTGRGEAGAALASDRRVGMVTLVGSVGTGRAVMRAAAETLKPVILELGGKNALIAFPDADPERVADAAIRGMNFGWCGQSCGSTSRLFLHAALVDEVTDLIKRKVAVYQPGPATDPRTTMGAIISAAQRDRILSLIEAGIADGARLVHGGRAPSRPDLAGGYFIEPTIFADVTQTMRIAQEEIFGPVLSILGWDDEADMIRDVNSVEYGLTCSIWTHDLRKAHRTASAVEAGYVWVNSVGTHFLGAPFGGYKQSGIGKENCLAELIGFTREKNVHLDLAG